MRFATSSDLRTFASSSAAAAAWRTPHTARLLYMPKAMDWNHTEVQKQLGFADVLVFQRNVIIPEVWAAMDYWRALGKVVLVDLDDHYPGLPPSNPAFTYWIRNLPGLNPDPVNALAEGLKHADALTSPGKAILKDWEHIVPGYWVPNWTHRLWYEKVTQKPVGAPDMVFDYDEKDGARIFRATPRKDSEGLVIIGWGGSISHVDSWVYSGIVEALERLFEKRPNVRLKFCGHENRLDHIFSKWEGRVIRQDGVMPADWPQVVSTFDIGLAPLDMRPIEKYGPNSLEVSYDERRSWLKAAEYLTAGVPWVASKSLTYAELARYGTLVENTADAWFDALDSKVQWLANQKEKASGLRRWAMKHITFEENVETYIQTLNRILIQKQVGVGAKLPGINWVTGKSKPKPAPTEAPAPVPVVATPAALPGEISPELREIAERGNWRAAHEWHEALGLIYQGVNLGDVMTFDALRVMGQLWLTHLRQPEASA